MSAAPKMCENPCETCAKEGLPLLLTRYAVMPSETGAPKLSGTLTSSQLDSIALGKGAHYGLRLLRSGYVYVYDQARDGWDEYFVTVDGILSKLPPRVLARKEKQPPNPFAPTKNDQQGDALSKVGVQGLAAYSEGFVLKSKATPAVEFRCARNGAAPLAGVITIRNPKHATKVWIAFSNVEWTHAVFEKHADEAHRRQHMRCITIADGKVASQPSTAPLVDIKSHLPEYRMEQVSAGKAFAKWCPHQYNGRQHAADHLIKAVQAARPQGGAAIVALHDPVALAMEISALMDMRKAIYANHEKVYKPFFAANAIASLEGSIKEQAKVEAMTDAQADDTLDQAIFNAVAGGRSASSLGVPEAAPRTFTEAQLQKIAQDKWQTYTHDRTGKPRFDAASSKSWLNEFNTNLAKLDAEHILPLAKAHVAWLQHDCMVQHMSCTFDELDPASNVAYTATTAQALQGTADKQPSYDLYVRWLKAGTVTPDNLLMRALGLNRQALIDKIKETDAKLLDARAFPTDMLLGYTKEALEKMPPSWQAAMGQLLQSTGGAMLTYLDAFAEGKAPGMAAAAIASMSGMQFTKVTAKGSKGKFIAHLMTELSKLDPNLKVKPNQLGQAVSRQLKLLAIEGAPMSNTDKRSWLVVLNPDVLPDSSAKGLKGDALAKKIAEAIQAPDRLPSLQASAFKNGVASPGFGALSGFCVGAIQMLNFTKLVADYTGAMKQEKSEAQQRMWAGAASILGTFGEATGAGLEALGEARLGNALGLKMSRTPNLLIQTGRRLGLLAGLFVAYLDLMQARDAKAKGDIGLTLAYAGSGILGGLLAAAFFKAAVLGPVAWFFVGLGVLLLLGVTAWIEKLKDNPVQEWLMRCHFGMRPQGEKYATQVEEAKDLEAAFS